jgi:HPt (histidine-containing phosphotransfer) domain-containing protein
MNDKYKLEKLSQYFAGDKNQFKEMIGLFLETVPPDIAILGKLAKQDKWNEILEVTHRIKPSLDVFEMNEIIIEINKIEHIAREKNLDGNLNSCIRILSENFNKISTSLNNELQKL